MEKKITSRRIGGRGEDGIWCWVFGIGYWVFGICLAEGRERGGEGIWYLVFGIWPCGGVKEGRYLGFEMEGEAVPSREVIGMGRR